jgi:ribosome-associated heat shock protein Hsp15
MGKARDEDADDLDILSQRLDKWLWHARFARTRGAAARLVEDGYVRVNTKRETTCARKVRAGDVLTIALQRDVRVVRVLGLAPRRAGRAAALSAGGGGRTCGTGNGSLLARRGQKR